MQRICLKPGTSFITTNTEHSSIKNLCDYLEADGGIVEQLPVDRAGRVHVEQLAEKISPKTALVSAHCVNNETGTIQPVEEIGKICREQGVLFHIDASQAAGKIPVNVEKLGCDLLSFSAHKFHGPQGVGGLYIRPGIRLTPLLFEGSQEQGRRAGTARN